MTTNMLLEPKAPVTALNLIDQKSSPTAKVALFRSLFRGREDVYPRRFESQKTGKSGYAPSCANEWDRTLCDKRTVKCSRCPNRRLLPVTDETIFWHLSGRDAKGLPFVMGVFPILQDETCFFLAADFDKKDWRNDAASFLETCHRENIPAALERSRSGEGGHVWLFFEQAVPANLARKLGSFLLTKTMERRPDIGLGSYDRLFPNQDTLPKGGFGNLIALPLQGSARNQGNSVFLDDHFVPFVDQWAFLSGLRRIPRARADEIVRDAEEKGSILGVRLVPRDEDDETPWIIPPSRRRKEPPITDPLPQSVEIILGDQIYISKDILTPGLWNRLVRLAAFQNPEFYKAQAMRLSTFKIPRLVGCAEDHPRHIALPRGCIDDVRQLFSDLRIETLIRDERYSGTPLTVPFQGKLRDDQVAAAATMAAHETGILAATTAFGKTVIGAWLIAKRGVNTLVVVHRRQLMDQWVERLAGFLGLPAKSIGRIGGGKKKPTGILDVAVIQSLVRKDVVNDLVGEYGHLVFDECHHLSAQSFIQVARKAKAKFITGLSATVTRKDGQHPAIFMQCGPIRFRVDARAQARERPFTHSVFVRPTGFRPIKPPDPDPRIQFHDLYDELLLDGSRNRLIQEDILNSIGEGRSPLVLTERQEHLDELARRLEGKIPHLIVLHGGMARKELKSIQARLKEIPQDQKRVVLATGRFIGEGFDDSRLDTLFLTLPVSWRGTIAQYAGRLHRLNDRKREVRVYDYADLDVPMLSRMFDRRCRGYEAIGYSILLPASAVPGWPTDVPLPVDPEWKKEYAASVRRLVLDGVDSPLANLFVLAARHQAEEITIELSRQMKPVSKGEESRARSFTEAFLYRRLETLPQTRGRFHLNLVLPIPFDGNGFMEVDLVCAEAHLAIELDGPHHLSGPDAYRRDRRKDALLQENGFFVLRFLAEDVGKHLDDILDMIHRVMAHRRQNTNIPNLEVP
ncbi:MAG: Type III restriction enzyme, res subunit [bacterium ADurb.Bin374]|nr:MAG: Type III restriction enzyme, res subunit [bacterium ADurb.Bin374]